MCPVCAKLLPNHSALLVGQSKDLPSAILAGLIPDPRKPFSKGLEMNVPFVAASAFQFITLLSLSLL